MLTTALVVLLAAALLTCLFHPYRFPMPTESDWATRSHPWWHIYYGFKWASPIKRSAFGSKLEQHFARDMSADAARPPLKDQQEIVLKAVGDLMCRRDLVGKTGRNLWDEVGEYVFDADLSLGNFEMAVNPDCFIAQTVRYSVPYAWAEPLIGDPRFGRFNVLTLGNNHINDSFTQGIRSTCKYIDSLGITRTGAHLSPEEQDQFPIMNCKGVRIAVLGYTFTTNGLPLEPDYQFGTNHVRFNALRDSDYDPSIIHRHIALAKKRGADLIIACNHWGVEFEYYPPRRIVQRAHDLLDAGIDMIVGCHPHITNPMERYATKDGRSALVFYSLGSLTSLALPLPVHKMSHIAEVRIESGLDASGKRVARLGDVVLTPVVFAMNGSGDARTRRLLPLLQTKAMMDAGTSPDYLTARDRRLVRAALREHALYLNQKGVAYR